MTEALLIPRGSVRVLEAMAEIAGVDRPSFIDQSLLFGLDLASMALGEVEGIEPDAQIWFEQPDQTHHIFDFDFSAQGHPDIETGLESREAEFPAEPLTLVLEQDRLAEVTRAAERLGTDIPSFLASCLFYRWQLALTRAHGGAILVRNSTEDDYLEITTDQLDSR
jgi:hypothetical protein